MVPGPSGPVKKENTPLLVVEGERALDESEGQFVLGLHDLRETAKFGVVQQRLQCNPVQAEYLLRKLLDRIVSETGWSETEALVNLLIRDFFEPSITEGRVTFLSNLEDTFRFYYVDNVSGSARWSSLPYHAASLRLGDVIHKDFAEGMGPGDYPEGPDGYPESEWDTGEPM